MSATKEIQEALEGVAVTLTMLDAANGASTRFNKLIKQMKLTTKLLQEYRELLQKEPAQAPTIQQVGSGIVSPLKPSDVGLDPLIVQGRGKVSPVLTR